MSEFLEALQQIAREKDIPLERLVEAVEQALAAAYKNHMKNHTVLGDVRVSIDSRSHQALPFRVYAVKHVVEELVDPINEFDLAEARELNPQVKVGDVVNVDLPSMGDFGRIAAHRAKQSVTQYIREAERAKVLDEFRERQGEVMTGTVQRREGRTVIIALGKLEAALPPQEQVDTEPYRINDRLKVYVLDVKDGARGDQAMVSRTHPSLIRRLFELEVPEIADGIVTIKSVAREPGARSKIAVASRDEKVDPVGACVGHRGTRVQAVVNELYDEKIDIVRWNQDMALFISESLSPAKVSKVTVNEEGKSAFVVVPDSQLSLAIGKAGQNVRLAARLTGQRIDIRSESQVARSAADALGGGAHGSHRGQSADPITDDGETLA